MSRASASRKARARREAAAREQQRQRQAFDDQIGALQQQLRLAGSSPSSITVNVRGRSIRTSIPTKMTNPNYRGPINVGGTIKMVINNPRPKHVPRRWLPYRIVSIPPASAREGIKKAIVIKQAERDVFDANANLKNIAQEKTPFAFSTAGISSGKLRLMQRQGLRAHQQALSANKSFVSKEHGAKVKLWEAKKNLAKAKGNSFSEKPPETPFLIQNNTAKLATLSKQSGFDVGKQLKKTNERFGLDLNVDDITANPTTGGLLGEAKTIFTRNRKIDKLKTEITPVEPETVQLTENTGFSTLISRRTSMINQQKARLAEINKIKDEDLRIARIETDLPKFKNRADVIDSKIKALEGRITKIRKTRKPQELLSTTGSLKGYRIRDLVARRNQLTKIRNEKADIFNKIDDPALRQVTLEQDIPQFDRRIGEIDSDIDRGVKFGESRKSLDIDIFENKPTRRNRTAKTFTVKIGGQERTFRRNVRGARRAKTFFDEQKLLKQQEIGKISDPVKRAVATEQDIGILDLGQKATKIQEKALKAERRQELENLNIGGASTTALPFTPADTPTGKLEIQPLPKKRGVPSVFNQLSFGGNDRPITQKRSRRNNIFSSDSFGGFKQNRNRRIDPRSADIGNIFGSSQKISKKNKGSFDFF